MFMHKSKKGFTIVELVIVIAVIAILAAVLIPTFSNLTKKANLSSDEQAVRQMNTALKTEFATAKPADLKAVIDALEKAGYNALTLKPHSKGYEFYWSGEDAIVMLVKTDDKSVRYPADLQLNEAKAEVLAEGAKFINVEVTSANIVEALTAGSDITLTEDIVLNSTVAVKGDMVINLNGYSLNGSGSASRPLNMTEGANLTLQAGGENVECGIHGLVNVPSEVKECSVTLEGGTYNADTDNGAFVRLRPGNEKVEITLKDVNYIDNAADGFALNTHGFGGEATILVEGGSFTANAGFQVPGKAKFVGVNIVTDGVAFEVTGEAEIIDCTITTKGATVGTAPSAAVAVSSGGTAKVSGCKINSDGDAYAVYSTGGTIIATNNTVLHAARQYFIYDLANGAAPASITIDGKVVAKQTK